MGLFGLISRMSHVMSHGICDATARAHIHMAHHHVIPDISGIILRMTWLIRDMSPKRPIFYQKRHIFYQKRPIFYQHDVWHDSRHGASCHTWYFRTHITYDMTGTAHAHIHMAHGSSRTWRDVTHACVCVCVCVMTWRDVICAHIHMTHITYGMTHIHISRRCTAQAPTFWVMKLRFGIIWFCTEKIESHDLVGFRSVEFLVESFICVPSDVLRLSFAFSFDGI